jgi:hypothetical protein
MRVGRVKPTALFGPYADGSNRPFTITARRAYDRLVTRTNERSLYMLFASLTAKVVTAVCALVGALALLGCFFVTVTGVAVRGVRPGHGVLRDVLGGLLLVDDLRAGTGPVAVARPPGTALRTLTGAPLGVSGLPEGVARATKTVMTRAELSGALFVAAVIGVLLASRAEGAESSSHS